MTEYLDLLAKPENTPLLKGIQRGMEKESLRITPKGLLAQTPHPKGLGSALTHPYITTDFSEALLELITPVSTSIDETLDIMDKVHRFTYSQLGDEKLWTASMPCIMKGDDKIPLAQYGSSNVATMKTTYRHGLGIRYGRLMQTIAGIHYNFSLPMDLWAILQSQDNDNQNIQDYITNSYFKLIRNFRRTSWLPVFLYGASPALCKSFLSGNEQHDLTELDNGTVYRPYGTSLRMGDLGYQSNAQEDLTVCYNCIDTYIETLKNAITNTQPDYEKMGVKVDGEYRQLSSALLQIENEFYSPIRPKRVTETGETALSALQQRGVEYIEVRCIDVNPYLPMGIDADQMKFIDCFLLFCLFDNSPICDDEDRERFNSNLQKVVNHGRDPGLLLQTRNRTLSLTDWGNQLMDGIDKIALLLDQAHGGNAYQQVCQQQRAKINNPDLTPSAKILADMKEHGKSFFQFAMDLSEHHNQAFRSRPLSETDNALFNEQSTLSVNKQHDIEQSDTINFDQYLADYYRQYEDL
jgi:glutamate--cysteine ligase